MDENEARADIEVDLKRAFEDEAKVRGELLERIDAAEKGRAAGKEVDVLSLAQDYLTLALEAQEEDDYEKIGAWLKKAVKLLESEPFPTEEMILLLAQARLTRGIALNDQGMWTEALAEYDAAETLLDKLSRAGNLDARLDLAGIRLNIATIKFELGEFEESMAEFEKVKSDFASLFSTPKEDEAYYYLAKTYLQEATVCREMGDDERGIQRLEEGIALYRRMIERGDESQSVDLAQALILYAQTLECLGEKEADGLLPIVEEAAIRLRKGVAAGRADVCPDLLEVSVMKGRLLNYLDRFDEADSFLTETAEIFEGVQETDDPEALLTLVTLYDYRGKARGGLGKKEEALADFTAAAEIASRLPADFFEPHEHEPHAGDCGCCGHLHVLQAEGLLALFSVYVDRAKALCQAGRIEEARQDGATVARILPRVEEYLGEDYPSYKDIYDALEKSLE